MCARVMRALSLRETVYVHVGHVLHHVVTRRLSYKTQELYRYTHRCTQCSNFYRSETGLGGVFDSFRTGLV